MLKRVSPSLYPLGNIGEPLLTGALFFKEGFVSPQSFPKRRRTRNRSKPLNGQNGGQEAVSLHRRKLKARLKKWKYIQSILQKHSEIPECEEEAILNLAEEVEGGGDPGSLETWTIKALLEAASSRDSSGLELLARAAEDIIDDLQAGRDSVIAIRSSNITTWRKEIQAWIKASKEDIFLLQETHLNKKAYHQMYRQMTQAGYQVFGGQAHPCETKGTKGGVCVLVKSHMQAASQGQHIVEGAGIEAICVRRGGVSLLLISVYLKCSTPLDIPPNSEIMAALLSVLSQHKGQWLVAGDWNCTPEELLSTNILPHIKGHLIATGEATCQSGRELDFYIISAGLQGKVRSTVDWTVPHRPHAGLCISLTVPGKRATLRQLPCFPEAIAVEEPVYESASVQTPISILGQTSINDVVSLSFARLSAACQKALYPNETMPRGASLDFLRKPALKPDPVGLYSAQPALWAKAAAWLLGLTTDCARAYPASGVHQLIGTLLVPEGYGAKPGWQTDLMNTLLGQSEVQEELVEWVNAIAKHSSSEVRKTGRAEYEEWITGAVKKGMRPLFRAVKAHEQCFDRPFRDHDPKSRPFLRLKQWMPIWKAGPSPAEACIARVKDRAICERATLAPLSSDEVGTRLRRCPLRAPGPDRWTPAMARSLPPEAVEELTAILNLIEEKGEAPAQWRIVKVVMLVKNEVVERPIGLCHIVYKIWMQARYGLIQAWLSEYTKTATWDAAQPGVACLSIAVQRVLQAEIAKCSKRPRISLFLDLSTFFETVDHHKLAHMAEILAFPATVLNVALQVYRGGRVICAEGQTSPPAFPTRGIVAGCPAAPVLSKVALHLPCSRASDSGLADNIDVWIDDISADFEGRNPAEVAWKAVKLYRQLRADLGSESLLLSEKKSAFICTDKTVAKSLQQLLKPGEPKIENLVKDLGVDSAGARRRRVKQSNTRLRKAGLRSQKLRQLRVPDKKCLHRASRASIFTAGTWGHQAAGLSPKRMKSVRAAAGTHAGRLGYGSLDVVYDLGENDEKDHPRTLEHPCPLCQSRQASSSEVTHGVGGHVEKGLEQPSPLAHCCGAPRRYAVLPTRHGV